MAEYIERDALCYQLAKQATIDGQPRAIRRAAKIVADFPAADVAPARHGHYVGEYDGFADGNPVYDMWYCSECGCYFEEWEEKPTYNYCPNCGALMDKDGDGDV